MGVKGNTGDTASAVEERRRGKTYYHVSMITRSFRICNWYTNPMAGYTPRNTREENLVAAFTQTDNAQDMANLLRDLLTPAEIEEFANRLEIARLLVEGKKSYLKIAEEVGTSTTTVTRVAQWLHDGCGGYKKLLEA